MKIPFHNIPKWKGSTYIILNNYHDEKNKGLISNVLYSYRRFPFEILDACTHFLNNWKTEIIIPIPQGKDSKGKKKEPH